MKYDVVVVGSGSGGYPAAVYLAKKGLRTAIIEEHLVGGECTNYGCVPSKALYNIAMSVRSLEKIGGEARLEWGHLIEWAKHIVKEARDGLAQLLEAAGVEIIEGKAALRSPNEITVDKGGEQKLLEARNVILAPGTNPSTIPGISFDGKVVISNREALFLPERPTKALIVGGGVIGVELANILSSFKVEVTVVELLEHILPFTDRDIAMALRSYLASRSVKVFEKTSVNKIEVRGDKAFAELSNGRGGEFDIVVLATGRVPRTSGMNLEGIGVDMDRKGFIKVNEKLETSVKGIYATGDAVGGPMLAHKAIIESIFAAMNITGKEKANIDYKLVPLTIFSGLEIASVGYTEKELASMGMKSRKHRIPLYYLAAVKIKDGKNAFVKILTSEDNEKVYGIHVVAPNASEVISSYLPLYLGKMRYNEIAEYPYPHLTVSESLRDLAEYILGEPIHLIMKK